MFLHYSRRLLVVGLVLVAGVVVSFTGSVTAASSANDNFLRQVAIFEQNGVSLDKALAAPMTVSRDGGSETIDNPLKYDYLTVAKAVASVEGTAMIGTALDLSTFVVIPLLFLILGAGTANHDRRHRGAMLRASRERWGTVVAAKALTIAAVGALAAVLVAVGGLLASFVGRTVVGDLRGDIAYDLLRFDHSPSVPKILMAAAVATIFGWAGYAIGWVTRSTSWPMVGAALALFALPFVSAWDPRNVLAVLASRVFDFWGQFQLRPPIEMSMASAALAAVVYVLVVVGVMGLSARRVPLR